MPRRVLAVLFAVVFLDLVGFGMVIPLLPLYADQYRPTPWVFGLLMASYSAMQFLFAPLLGSWSDRWGRRPVLLVSLAGSVVGYLLFGLADSLAMLFASRVIAGVAGGNIATAQAVIADVTKPEERAKGMALVGAAFGLGFILGPSLAGLLLHYSPRLPGLAAATFSTMALLAAWWVLPETRNTAAEFHPRRPRLLAAASVRRLLPVAFLVVTAWSSFEVTFAQFVNGRWHLSPRQVAWLFAYVGVLAVVVQGVLVRRLPPRWAASAVLQLGLSVTALALLLVVRVPTVAGLLLVLPLLALGQGLANPSLSAWVSQRASAAEQGEALGAFQGVSSLARVVGPFLGEMALGHWGLGAPAVIACAFLLLALLWARLA
ncbi:MAG: MFS transporter [Thermoanaerobaculum sp.]|nr:MFS transporter [Thermoanaerobaculum sp.]